MKVAFIVNEFPSLSQTFILNQIVGLIERGHEVDIFAECRGPVEAVHEGIHTYRLMERVHFLSGPEGKYARGIQGMSLFFRNVLSQPLPLFRAMNPVQYGMRAASLTLLFEIVPFLRNGPYEVLHCQFGWLGPRVIFWKKILGWSSKVVVSFRGYDATGNLRRNPAVFDDLFERGDLFLPVCEALRKQIVTAGCSPGKTAVLQSGIDCQKFSSGIGEGKSFDSLALLSVGRLVEKKGFGCALSAVAELIRKGRKLRYAIVGEGPLRNEFEGLIRQFGIEESVQLLGGKTQEEIIQLMKSSQILVAPSVTSANGDQEGIPNVLKEAMALGLPVVSTFHSGIPELVEDGVSGFLVPEHNIAALVERLEWLLDDPERRQSMGAAGRAAVESKFDHERLNDRLVSLYVGLFPGGSFPA